MKNVTSPLVVFHFLDCMKEFILERIPTNVKNLGISFFEGQTLEDERNLTNVKSVASHLV